MNRDSSSESPSPGDGSTREPAAATDSKAREYVLVPVEAWDSDTRSGDSGVNGNDPASGIRWVTLLRAVLSKWRVLALTGLAGIVLGVAVHMLMPSEYLATTTLMPEYSTESLGGGTSQLLQRYGQLLGGATTTYNSTSNAIRVDLYPSIVASAPLLLKLMETPFHVPSQDTTVDLFTYFTEVRRPSAVGHLLGAVVGAPSRLIGTVFGEGDARSAQPAQSAESPPEILELTEAQAAVMTMLQDRVMTNLDPASAIVTVSARMEDPVLAAGVARRTVDLLTEYLVEYRLDKVRMDLAYIDEQKRGAQTRFEESQLALAEFVDGNVGMLSARAQVERERLNSEYTIAFNLYNTLSQQYEQAKLKVQEQTPVFKTLQPVRVPLQDTRSGLLTVLGVAFLVLSLQLARMVLEWMKPMHSGSTERVGIEAAEAEGRG